MAHTRVLQEAIFKMILRGQVDLKTAPWPSISDPAKDLVMKLLNRDPLARLTAQQVGCAANPASKDTRADRPAK